MQITIRSTMAGALSLLLTACLPDARDKPSTTPSVLTPTAASNCVFELDTGTCHAVTINGVGRYFYIIKPSSFSADRGMLLVLHGLGDAIEWQNEFFNATEVANRTGKLLVFGLGTALTGPARTGKVVWNATAACCYFDKLVNREYIPDDMAYLDRVMSDVIDEYDLNRQATVVWGYSNGAFMSNRLACERSEMIAAVITQSGAMRQDINECKPENPVSSFHIHGTLDQTINFGGDTTDRDVFAIYKGIPGLYTRAFYPGAEEITDHWLNVNGCNQTPASVATLTNFTIYDNVRYLNDYTTIPEPEQEVTRNATLTRYGGCRDQTAVQSLRIEDGKHKPVYDQAAYTQLVTDFIQAQGTRTFTPVSDQQDRGHDDINDSSAAVVQLSGAGLVGAALVRNLGSGEFFVRAGFSVLQGKNITAIRLLNDSDQVLASTSGAALTNTQRFAYTTLTGSNTTPSKLQVVVDGNTITGAISWGNAPFTVETLLGNGSGGEAQVTVQMIGGTRLNFSVHVNDALNPTTITNIRLVSVTKTINLYPIPSGLPDPDDYDGDHTFWDIVKTGGFKFVANAEEGGFDVEGYAEAKGVFPYYYEEMVGDPSLYQVIISTGTGDLVATMGTTPI